MSKTTMRRGIAVLTFLFMMLLATTVSYGADVAIDKTNFPDKNFRKHVKEYDENGDGILSDSERNEVSYMECWYENISSLEGIKYFKNLTSLWVGDNQLQGVLDVSMLHKVDHFSCSWNKLTGVKLSSKAPYEYVWVCGNRIKNKQSVKGRSIPWDGDDFYFGDQDPHIHYYDQVSSNKRYSCICGKKAPVVNSVTNLKARLTGYNDIKLTWSKVKGVDGYKVYQKKTLSGGYVWEAYKLVKTTSKTSLTFLNRDTGLRFVYKVVPYKEINGSIVEGKAKTASVWTMEKTWISSIGVSDKKVKIEWYNISGETGYQISKSSKKNGTNIVATVKGSAAEQKKISAKSEKTYYYKVRAYKVENGKKIYGPWSNVEFYTRTAYKKGMPSPPKNFTYTSWDYTAKKDVYTLKWDKAKNAKGYLIYIFDTSGEKEKIYKIIKTKNVQKKKIEIPSSVYPHVIRIKSYNDTWVSDFSSDQIG